MNIVENKYTQNFPYYEGYIYYKPLEKFAKFGTSGVRWLVKGASDILKDDPQKIAYYMSNKYKRTIDGKEVLAEDFNMPNVGMVIKSIALYNLQQPSEIKNKLAERGILVVYDNRPGNLEYAQEAAKILSAYGIKAVLAKSEGVYVPTPLPAASRIVQIDGYAGAIIFTASHNGDEWNGIKFEGADGGAAMPSITNAIGSILARELSINDPDKPVTYKKAAEDIDALVKEGRVDVVNISDLYVDAISSYLDVNAIKKSINDGSVEFVYSAFFGSSGPVIVKLFKKLGLPTSNIIETQKSADQGYVASYEPTLDKLKKLMFLVKSKGELAKKNGLSTIVIGGAADNDADRFQVNQYNKLTMQVDEFTPEKLSAIFAHYLYKYKGFKGPVGRSFVSGSLIDEVAKLFEERVVETATGFKFSPKVFIENKGIIFVEESYGLSFKGWTLDKDGILPSLLALELIAVTGKGLDEYYSCILDELSERGLDNKIAFKRYDKALDESVKQDAMKKFVVFYESIVSDSVGKVKGDTYFAGHKVTRRYDPRDYDGGMKFVLDNGSWVALRSSGTEPLIRFYLEAHGNLSVDDLRVAVFKLVGIKE